MTIWERESMAPKAMDIRSVLLGRLMRIRERSNSWRFMNVLLGRRFLRHRQRDARLDLNLFKMIMQAGNDTTK
jgi:hypothetical protein